MNLEHALDINLWIDKARNLLVNNGIIAVAVPNYGSIFRVLLQENDPFITPPEHLNYFNAISLGKALEKHNFKVVANQWVSRIPATAFASRLPAYPGLISTVTAISKVGLGMIDALRLGMIINIYAKKLGA